MKRMIASILLLGLLCTFSGCPAPAEQAYAENRGSVYERTIQICADLPSYVVRVTDTGEDTSDPVFTDHILLVELFSQEGELLQSFTFESNQTPEYDGMAALVMTKDLNFDGYQDLMLLTAAGAQNVFYAISIWDSRTNRYRPVERACEWNRETCRWAEEPTQVELCNVELYPEKRMLVSEEQDGFRYRRAIFYMFDGTYMLEPKYIWDIYDAGDGLIGESLTEFMTHVVPYWDEQYPEAWYYGEEEVASAHRQAVWDIAFHNPSANRTYRIANVDWVNLRQQSSKQSPSLAKLDKGTEVVKLHDGIGEDSGWVRVLYFPPCQSIDEMNGITGYIWHSYLE